jgi:hypothetical protein
MMSSSQYRNIGPVSHDDPKHTVPSRMGTHTLPLHPVPGHASRAVEDMRNKTDCPLCRLVLVALGGDKVPTHEDGEPLEVVMDWNTERAEPQSTGAVE